MQRPSGIGGTNRAGDGCKASWTSKRCDCKGNCRPAPTVPPPPAVQPVADGQPEAERPKPPPLTVHEQKVLDLIRARPAGTGITGRGIIDALNKQGNAPEQSTLTRHIIPKLKRWFGVENAGGGRGYFIPPT